MNVSCSPYEKIYAERLEQGWKPEISDLFRVLDRQPVSLHNNNFFICEGFFILFLFNCEENWIIIIALT